MKRKFSPYYAHAICFLIGFSLLLNGCGGGSETKKASKVGPKTKIDFLIDEFDEIAKTLEKQAKENPSGVSQVAMAQAEQINDWQERFKKELAKTPTQDQQKYIDQMTSISIRISRHTPVMGS